MTKSQYQPSGGPDLVSPFCTALGVLVIPGLLAGYIAPGYLTQLGKLEVKTTHAQVNSAGKRDQFTRTGMK